MGSIPTVPTNFGGVMLTFVIAGVGFVVECPCGFFALLRRGNDACPACGWPKEAV